MPDCIILADDITGALDTGVRFAVRERRVQVYLDPDETGSTVGCDVVGINTDTRHASPDEAYRVVSQVCKRLEVEANVAGPKLCGSTAPIIYKKIDSTLRGNIGAETDAVMDTFSLEVALLTPAYPATARVVRGGRCLVDGVPLSNTESGRDPFSPVHSSDVECVFTAQSKRRTATLELSDIRSGENRLEAVIAAHLQSGVQIFIADAESDDDLVAVCRTFREMHASLHASLHTSLHTSLHASPLYIGSAGLASAVALLVGSPGVLKRKHVMTGPRLDGEDAASRERTLVISGSLMPTAMRQIEALGARQEAGAIVRFRGDDFLANPESAVERLRAGVTDRLAADRLCVIAPHPDNHVDDPGAHASIRDSDEIASHIGKLARSVVESAKEPHYVENIVVVGGSTASSVFSALKISTVLLTGELEAGVVASKAVAGINGRTYNLVTKSGGFGDEQTLVRICDRLAREMGGVYE